MSRPDFIWKLPAEIAVQLGKASYGAQRAIHEADHLLLVLHEPPAPREAERTTAVFLRQLLDRYRQRLTELERQHSTAVSQSGRKTGTVGPPDSQASPA